MASKIQTSQPTDLLNLDLLRTLSQADQNLLLESASIVTFDAGQQLLFRNDTLPGLFLVVAGHVFAQTRVSKKKALTHSFMGSGALFGFSGLVGRLRSEVSLFAKTNGSIVVVGFDVIQELMARNKNFTLKLFEGLEAESAAMRAQSEELALQDAQGRLAAWILRKECTQQSPSPLRTQSEIAAEIGTVREVVSRGLARLEREEVIQMHGKRIEVKDAQRLEELSTFLPDEEAEA